MDCSVFERGAVVFSMPDEYVGERARAGGQIAGDGSGGVEIGRGEVARQVSLRVGVDDERAIAAQRELSS